MVNKLTAFYKLIRYVLLRTIYLLLGFGTVLGGEIVVGIRKIKFLPVG